MTDIENIERIAQVLDDEAPGWAARVDADPEFNMWDADHCVYANAFGREWSLARAEDWFSAHPGLMELADGNLEVLGEYFASCADLWDEVVKRRLTADTSEDRAT